MSPSMDPRRQGRPRRCPERGRVVAAHDLVSYGHAIGAVGLERDAVYDGDILERGHDSDVGSERMRAALRATIEGAAADLLAEVVADLAPLRSAIESLAQALLEADDLTLSGLTAAIEAALARTGSATDLRRSDRRLRTRFPSAHRVSRARGLWGPLRGLSRDPPAVKSVGKPQPSILSAARHSASLRSSRGSRRRFG